MKKKKNIRFKLCMLAIGPLLCLGIATLIIASLSVYSSTVAETKDGLKNLAYALYHLYVDDNEGDFEWKDSVILNGKDPYGVDFSMVDKIKAVSGVDATIFYNDIRLLTTIRNPDGSRAVGTHAAPEVVKEVLEEGNDYFSRNVSVDNMPYFGYYIPIHGNEGQIVGMVFVGKTRKMVINAVSRTIERIFISVVAVSVAAGAVSVIYAREMVYSLNKTKEFLGGIARGNVEEDIDSRILNRADEIGEMGNFAVGLKSFINELVSMDPLTGLYNRRTCEVMLPNIINEYERYHTPFVVAIGDVDFFKGINDTHGHQGGDAVLKGLAGIFREHMERKGFVARWGGEEFMFIYERMELDQVQEHLDELARRIRSERITYNGAVIPVTMTFGAAACGDGVDLRTLVKTADDNLYYGKNNGRDQVITFRMAETES